MYTAMSLEIEKSYKNYPDDLDQKPLSLVKYFQDLLE